MRNSILAGIVLAAISTTAMAETPVAAEVGKQAAEIPGEKMRGRMDEHMERMWKEMDANGDGSISREESTAFGNKKFDERDANKDGKITREEWDNFRKAKMEEMKSRHEKMMDKNGGGGAAPEKK